MKIAVVGSGISGLSIAHILKNSHQVTVFEKEDAVGGLIKCDRINDCVFHRVGGHVFNSKDPKVNDWFWSFFNREEEFVKATRNAKVYIQNKIINYPIENNIYLFDKDTVKNIVGELLTLQGQPARSPFDYPNFEEFLQQSFGETLYQLYFKPYNQKIWKTDLKTVSMQWLEGKLPMPRLQEILESNILREGEVTMTHSSFYYPKEDGSQFIVNRLRKGLNIVSNTNVTDVEEKDGRLIIAGQEFDKLIYCGDIRKFPKFGKELMRDNNVDVDYVERLRSNGTSNLFCETDDNDISWLYIPEDFTNAHRIIYTGNFSETNNRGSKRKTCVVEFSGKVEVEKMKEEIKKLPGNLTPLAHNFEANSYVVQDHQTRSEIKKAKAALKQKNMFLLGRFAEWEYYNMDKAMEAAFNLFESEFDG